MNTLKKGSSYESAMAVTLLLLIIYYFFFPVKWFLLATIAFVLLVLLSKTLAKYVHWLWETLTKAIGFVMNRVLMSAVFIVFLTPIALLYRLFKKKSLSSEESNFIDRKHQFSAKDIESPW